ncbi:MAG: phosphotransferase [Clostridia bacterium]|nr:phosphotransferase [Clostridia bacterium]
MDIKNLIKEKFNFNAENIEILGEGYDSKAFLVNNEYVFKIKMSTNNKKGYEKEKAVLDFLNKNLKTDIKIPKIDFYYVKDEISIMGYKRLNGKFLNPEVYNQMTRTEKFNLKNDIAKFLKQMHSLNYTEIKNYTIDNKQNCLEEYDILKNNIYDQLSEAEKNYIENFYIKLSQTTVFDDKKCLCHNDFSCNHLLLDDNNKLTAIIDFGDAGIIDEYCDFLYLLEDSEEEIGKDFGEDILSIYGNIDIDKVKEYQDLVEEYYPIETIVYGIRNNKMDFIEKGRKELSRRI